VQEDPERSSGRPHGPSITCPTLWVHHRAAHGHDNVSGRGRAPA
jgi:hypothetical protein